jgi:hypothetical protein
MAGEQAGGGYQIEFSQNNPMHSQGRRREKSPYMAATANQRTIYGGARLARVVKLGLYF